MTPAEIRAMTAPERTLLFIKLATDQWGSAWRLPLPVTFEIDRRTIDNWLANDNMPIAVLYALAAWREHGECEVTLGKVLAHVAKG